MDETFGMDARYPLPSGSAKFFMGGYFLVIVAGWFGGLENHGWFWIASFLVGIPWLGALSNYFHTLWCREGYAAALADMTSRTEYAKRGARKPS